MGFFYLSKLCRGRLGNTVLDNSQKLHFPELLFLIPSAPPYPWVEPDESQSQQHPGVLAAASSQTQPRTCFCVPSVLSYGHGWAGNLCRAARPEWELHPVPSAGSAARHHLSDPNVRFNPSGLEPTVRLELPSHAQNIQRHRWEHNLP